MHSDVTARLGTFGRIVVMIESERDVVMMMWSLIGANVNVNVTRNEHVLEA